LLLRLLDRADEGMGQEWLMTVFVEERCGNARPMRRSRELRNFRFARRTTVAVRQIRSWDTPTRHPSEHRPASGFGDLPKKADGGRRAFDNF
jgi:hypothetical protein